MGKKLRFFNLYKSEPRGRHAEDLFLDNFDKSNLENADEVIMFINYSPCWKCADRLLQFVSTLSDRNITISIRCKYLYHIKPSKYIDDEKEIKKNRQGLYNLSRANVKLKMISNKDLLELFEWLQVDQPDNYSNYDGSTIRPLVENISNQIACLAQPNCPSGVVTTNFLPVLDEWRTAMMEQTTTNKNSETNIEILINKMIRSRKENINVS